MKLKKSLFLSISILATFVLPVLAEKKVGVLPLEVLSTKPELKALSNDIAFNLSESLKLFSEFDTLDSSQIENVIKELNLKPNAFNDLKNTLKVGKYISSDLLLSANLEIGKNNLYTSELKFTDIDKGVVIKTVKVSSKNIFDLQNLILLEVLKNQSIKLDNNKKEKLKYILKATTSNKALDFYYQGIRSQHLYSYQDYENAIKFFDKAIEIDKNYKLPFYAKLKTKALLVFQMKKDSLEYQKQLEQLESELNSLNEVKSIEVYKAKAILSSIKNDLKKAKLELKEAFALNKNDEETLLLDWIVNGSKIEDKVIEKLVNTDPFNSLIYQEIGLAFQNNHKLEEAESYFKESLKVNSKNASVLYYLSDIFYKTGRFEDASIQLKNAIKIKDDFWLAHFKLAQVYKHENLYDTTIKEYTKTLAINPKSFEANFELGTIYTEKGDLDKAEESYKNAIILEPENYEGHYYLATVYKLADKTDESIKEYKEAIRLNSNFAEAYYQLGIAYKYNQEFELAIAEYKKAIKLNPDFAEAYLNLGVVYFEQNKFTEALNEYKTAIKVRPNYPRAYNNIGLVYQKQGKQAEAIAQFKTAIKLNPSSYTAYFNLGQIYKEQKKLKEALEEFRKACKLGYQPACIEK